MEKGESDDGDLGANKLDISRCRCDKMSQTPPTRVGGVDDNGRFVYFAISSGRLFEICLY